VVEDEAGAYKVFETLNARGLELTAGDLLKSYLLSVVHPGQGDLEIAQQAVSMTSMPRDLASSGLGGGCAGTSHLRAAQSWR
jgi:hypothetical protein